jgi:hypothetical protein
MLAFTLVVRLDRDKAAYVIDCVSSHEERTPCTPVSSCQVSRSPSLPDSYPLSRLSIPLPSLPIVLMKRSMLRHCDDWSTQQCCLGDSTNGESHSKLVSSWILDLLRNMFLSACGPENELPHSPGYPQYGEYVHGVHAQKATKASSDESCEWDENGWEDCYDPRKKIEDDYKCIYTVW